MTRVLLYGDVDLNLIDGSAIWLASLAEVLGGIKGVSVTVLLKTPITRDLVTRSAAALPSVRFLDPWAPAVNDSKLKDSLTQHPAKKLTPDLAATLIAVLDREQPFDVIVVRSIEATLGLAYEPELPQRLWTYVTDPLRYRAPADCAKLRLISNRCCRVVCQTEEAKAALAGLLEASVDEKVIVLPPMVPTVAKDARPVLDPAAPRLGYSGKFSPPYMMIEMLDAFEEIRSHIPAAEFHVVGDKFHNSPPVEGYTKTLTHRLSETPGVIWHGGVSRDEVNEILSGVHVASSWRSPAFDNSLELSTKVLEYAALGIPILMNPSQIQHRVFGREYPAYVTTQHQFVERFLALATSPAHYEQVSRSVQTTAEEFTFESIRRRMVSLICKHTSSDPIEITGRQDASSSTALAKGTRPIRLLFNGHDLKFIRNFIRSFSHNPRYEVSVDEWKGHNTFDQHHSESMLQWADVIYCEWCLGNAKWYSLRKRPDQRLIIRLHHQEMGLPYRRELEWSSVDAVIFTNFTHYNTFCREQPENAHKAVVVYCDIDCDTLDQEKLPDAEFNLGLVGINPMRKRPDMAYAILEKLRRIDSRYTLFFKTRMPWEYKWLWERPHERKYFEQLLAAIDAGPLRNSVVFESHGDDMETWYSKVGFILSTSDHEGTHQAVAEGMGSGCIPIVRDWDGATPLYPARFVFSSINEAVDLIQSFRKPERYAAATSEAKTYARKHFDTPVILRQIEMLFDASLLAGDAREGVGSYESAVASLADTVRHSPHERDNNIQTDILGNAMRTGVSIVGRKPTYV